MWQLLLTITEIINMLFPVVNFLKCVVTDVVLFSMVAFKTLDISQGSVATQLRCDKIFIAIFFWFRQWNNFKNRLIFGKVKAYKTLGQFLGHPVYCMRTGTRTRFSDGRVRVRQKWSRVQLRTRLLHCGCNTLLMRYIMPPGESRWVCRRDRQTDGRQIVTLYFPLWTPPAQTAATSDYSDYVKNKATCRALDRAVVLTSRVIPRTLQAPYSWLDRRNDTAAVVAVDAATGALAALTERNAGTEQRLSGGRVRCGRCRQEFVGTALRSWNVPWHLRADDRRHVPASHQL